jgi:hypothetical protein
VETRVWWQLWCSSSSSRQLLCRSTAAAQERASQPHRRTLTPTALPQPRPGLLLNNLSVYRGCEIVFDSMDVPESALDGAEERDPLATVREGQRWSGRKWLS